MGCFCLDQGNAEYWEPLVWPFFVECFRILQRRRAHETSLNAYVSLVLSQMLNHCAILSRTALHVHSLRSELYWCGGDLSSPKLDARAPGCTDQESVFTQYIQAL